MTHFEQIIMPSVDELFRPEGSHSYGRRHSQSGFDAGINQQLLEDPWFKHQAESSTDNRNADNLAIVGPGTLKRFENPNQSIASRPFPHPVFDRKDLSPPPPPPLELDRSDYPNALTIGAPNTALSRTPNRELTLSSAGKSSSALAIKPALEHDPDQLQKVQNEHYILGDDTTEALPFEPPPHRAPTTLVVTGPRHLSAQDGSDNVDSSMETDETTISSDILKTLFGMDSTPGDRIRISPSALDNLDIPDLLNPPDNATPLEALEEDVFNRIVDTEERVEGMTEEEKEERRRAWRVLAKKMADMAVKRYLEDVAREEIGYDYGMLEKGGVDVEMEGEEEVGGEL
ncbi:hypothetical protein HK102_011682 [Quaeritorhiza haematococci]|nr:hypothetical protein HK102_011682 [Quaeritorhiza haematococci]